MIHSSILLFDWNYFGKGVGILTACVWAVFFFYDYFIRGAESKDSILDNPSRAGKNFDHRPQIHTETVEYDSMIK
jgi:hypothetical protein